MAVRRRRHGQTQATPHWQEKNTERGKPLYREGGEEAKTQHSEKDRREETCTPGVQHMRQTLQSKIEYNNTHEEEAQVPVSDLLSDLQSETRTEAARCEGPRAAPLSLQYLRVQEQQQVHAEGPLYTKAHQ